MQDIQTGTNMLNKFRLMSSSMRAKVLPSKPICSALILTLDLSSLNLNPSLRTSSLSSSASSSSSSSRLTTCGIPVVLKGKHHSIARLKKVPKTQCPSSGILSIRGKVGVYLSWEGTTGPWTPVAVAQLLYQP